MEEWPDHFVRVMADYCSEGVWDSEGCAGSVDELPLSPDLQAALRAWALWYDRCRMHDPTFRLEEFAAEGLALARRVKAELPDWTVMYFDEQKAATTPRTADREYEIK